MDASLLFEEVHNPKYEAIVVVGRGPIVLTIDEAEFLLDQMPAPSTDEDTMVTKLRQRLQDLLTSLRSGAEGTAPTQ
ncbi:hypothetical protein DAEQUDRAFT_729579, partial [Daedalea quercina L-15889]